MLVSIITRCVYLATDTVIVTVSPGIYSVLPAYDFASGVVIVGVDLKIIV